MINESYNYCVAGDYGKVSLNQFLNLTKNMLESLYSPVQLESIFAVFTGEQAEA